VFELYKLVASEAEVQAMREKLAAGNYGWGHAKDDLFQVLDRELGPKREVFKALRADEKALDLVLEEGEERARAIAKRTMERVRRAIGIGR
jgi:tryptophanyl-tRNA synthetase